MNNREVCGPAYRPDGTSTHPPPPSRDAFPGHGRQTAWKPAVDAAGVHRLVSQAAQPWEPSFVTLYAAHQFNQATLAEAGAPGQQSQDPDSVVTTQSASNLQVPSPMLRAGVSGDSAFGDDADDAMVSGARVEPAGAAGAAVRTSCGELAGVAQCTAATTRTDASTRGSGAGIMRRVALAATRADTRPATLASTCSAPCG